MVGGVVVVVVLFVLSAVNRDANVERVLVKSLYAVG